MNILENEKLISSSQESFKTSDKVNTSQVTSAASSSGAAGGGVAGAIAGSIPAVAVVTVLVTVMSSFLLTAPKTKLTNINIDHEEVGLTIELEESDNPYFASLLNNNEVIETIEISSNEEIIFSNLDYETTYLIVIENDYGLGLNKISEYEITTSSQPVYPNGKLRIDDQTDINYNLKRLDIYFDLNDEHKYLSNFKVIVKDDIFEKEFTDVNINEIYRVDLEGFSRGYLTITVISDSRHPQSGLNKVLTTYKIYY